MLVECFTDAEVAGSSSAEGREGGGAADSIAALGVGRVEGSVAWAWDLKPGDRSEGFSEAAVGFEVSVGAAEADLACLASLAALLDVDGDWRGAAGPWGASLGGIAVGILTCHNPYGTVVKVEAGGSWGMAVPAGTSVLTGGAFFDLFSGTGGAGACLALA